MEIERSNKLVAAVAACVALGVLFAILRVDSATPESPFDGDRAYALVEELVAIGTRVPGSPGNEQARALIHRELNRAILKVQDYSFKADTSIGSIEMTNIVGIVPGTREEIIVLGTHFDTKYLPDIEFVGANDGASTTAWMLEMARILGAQGVPRQGYTLWLCFFDGEEAFGEWSETDGLYGSRALVDGLKETGGLKNVKAMVNVDMIGDCDLALYRDSKAPKWLGDLFWEEARSLGYGDHFWPVGEAIEDDHEPFRRAGIPALNLIDFRYGGGRREHEQNWHTAADTLDKVCPESLKIVGDVVYRTLPRLERQLDNMESR